VQAVLLKVEKFKSLLMVSIFVKIYHVEYDSAERAVILLLYINDMRLTRQYLLFEGALKKS